MPNLKPVLRILDKMGFFSKLGEEVQRLPMTKGSGDQFYSMLLKQGVKPDELKYSGTDKFLKSRGAVAQQELQDYVNKNRLQLGDMEYSERRVQDNYAGPDEDYSNATYFPKHDEGHQTKGGTNYRELGTTLPDQRHTGSPSFYHEDHYPDENIIESRRVKDYETPSGEQVSLVDETQSDWAQKGRDEGFRVEGLAKSLEDAKSNHSAIRRRFLDTSRLARDFNHNDDANIQRLDMEMLEAEAKVKELAMSAKAGHDQGPYVDNTSKWTDLSIKRGLTDAAREGKDFYAWPKGGDVADRYSMRKLIKDMSYRKLDDKTGGWEMDINYNGEVATSPHNSNAKNLRVKDYELHKYVGQELAEKIRSGAGETRPHNLPNPDEVTKLLRANNSFSSQNMDKAAYDGMIERMVATQRLHYDKAENTRHLKGSDIPVGGEGHRKYYDDYTGLNDKEGKEIRGIYPSRVREVMRQNVEPVNVEDVGILAGGEPAHTDKWNDAFTKSLADAGYNVPKEALNDTWVFNKWAASHDPDQRDEIISMANKFVDNPPQETKVVQGIRLTPEMRQKILASGFPLFAIAAQLGISKQDLEVAMQSDQVQKYADGGRVMYEGPTMRPYQPPPPPPPPPKPPVATIEQLMEIFPDMSKEEIIERYFDAGDQPQQYDKGGFVKKALRTLMNVGMDAKNGSSLTKKEIIAAINATGAKVKRSTIHQSNSEPTMVMQLDRPLTPDEANNVSAILRQEAIAQVDPHGVGELYGPGAEQWKPFNPEYFLKSNGKYLKEPQAVAPMAASPNVPPKVDLEPIGQASSDLRGYVEKELDELD